VREQSDRLTRQIREVEAELADAGRTDALGLLVVADPWRVWTGKSTPARKLAIAALYRVEILPPGRGTRTFRADTVVLTPR
jgi:site-specific DNA recombinase